MATNSRPSDANIDVYNSEKDVKQDADRVRVHFDRAPYPDTPISYAPGKNSNVLFVHSAINATYRRDRQVIDPAGLMILDAGCGSGVTSQVLAVANPGARVVGVDISPASIEVAKQRLAHHGFSNVEFHAMPLEDVPQLGLEFDYINCDETLYLVPDPLAGLQAMRSVLKPKGTIRANLHNKYQRQYHYRGQRLFKLLGLRNDQVSQENKIAMIRDLMAALNNEVDLKRSTWLNSAKTDETILANYLLQGDKGFNVLDLFELLAGAELELIDMVNWQSWQVLDLIQNQTQMPEYLEMVLSMATQEQYLHLFELLNPIHRTLDFWCGHVGVGQEQEPIAAWDQATWLNARARLHPHLKTSAFGQALANAIAATMPLNITQFLGVTTPETIEILPNSAVCLQWLWQEPRSVADLAQTWLKVKPYNWVTGTATTEVEAFNQVVQVLAEMESFMFVLLESD
ncbi:Methyltransferase type 12 [Thalassoporum mexicanum PCC 7367]|uniref:class I SAM-dependent methyltransferase n=1 Tax=Thalassoporum mexicanum TaxID=3457544 RepID=UPI00029FDA70|nr:class I SAM-dependent methyltransferase [Pseudanabaena sp. PCC 7367]AFY69654.1 Methyltransferase type 12 [Pseudanabaena sp. PCC 7367]